MNSIFEWITSVGPPWIALAPEIEPERSLNLTSFYSSRLDGMAIRKLRGQKMMTMQSLMDEFGAVLQFFDGFGENWYALGECLSYMDEWIPANGYLLIITDAQDVLVKEQAEDLQWFLKTMTEAGFWWSKPIKDNQRFNRPSIPFHVFFRYNEEYDDLVTQRYQDKIENIHAEVLLPSHDMLLNSIAEG